MSESALERQLLNFRSAWDLRKVKELEDIGLEVFKFTVLFPAVYTPAGWQKIGAIHRADELSWGSICLPDSWLVPACRKCNGPLRQL